MPEVEAHLSEMREAAEKMRRAGYRIGQSVQYIHQSLLLLVTLGVDSPTLRLLLGSRTIVELAEEVQSFAAKLDEAADDMEQVYAQTKPQREMFDPAAPLNYIPVFAAGAAFRLNKRPLDPSDSERRPELSNYAFDDFISRANRPVYDNLTQAQIDLAGRQEILTELLAARQQTAEDLEALKNRLASFNPNVQVDQMPRVQAMQLELQQLDGQISATRQEIQDLRLQIDQLTARLDRVKPGPGADLRLIADLEKAPTSPWISTNTYDCVKYIVNKMPVPNGIARDAYLWDDAAAQFTEYGITQGDTPLVGSVIVLEREHSYADDVFGHLFYVQNVDLDGTVWVTDNDHPDPVRLTDLTHELSGNNIKYLYFPWHTRA